MDNYEIKPYIVYIKVDDNNRVTNINSSAFLTDTEDWIEIDRGYGDKYHHAQGNYLDKPLIDTSNFAHNYMYEDGEIREATEEEKQEEISERPTPPPTTEERVEVLDSSLQGIMEDVLPEMEGRTADLSDLIDTILTEIIPNMLGGEDEE